MWCACSFSPGSNLKLEPRPIDPFDNHEQSETWNQHGLVTKAKDSNKATCSGQNRRFTLSQLTLDLARDYMNISRDLSLLSGPSVRVMTVLHMTLTGCQDAIVQRMILKLRQAPIRTRPRFDLTVKLRIYIAAKRNTKMQGEPQPCSSAISALQ